MKKVVLLLVFAILIGSFSMVFADKEVLGSITINFIDKDTQEVIEWEILSDLEMGEHIINSRLFEGYELDDTVTKVVYLEEGSEHQEVNFNYIKIQEKLFDGQAHLKFIDEETREVTYTEDFQLVEGEILTIPIKIFKENEMLEVGDFRLISDSQTSVEGAKVNMNFDYNIFDENYISNLVVEFPIGVYDFTADLEIEYRKVKPFIRVQQWLDGEMIGQSIKYLDTLGNHIIQAEEIDGLVVIGESSKEVTLDYLNHNTEIVKFYYTFGLDPETPEIPSIAPNIPEIPHIPYIPESLIEYEYIPAEATFVKLKDEIEKVPETNNIPLGDFISRWLHHEPITVEPFKVEKEQRIKFEITKEQQELMKKKGLQPRLYYFNEEKEKWVALSSKVNKNKIETYKEVSGWIAVFGVKQPDFTDVRGTEWFIEKMDRANGLAIVEGVGKVDGSITLNPYDLVTKKELYAMVGRIFGAVQKGQTSLYNELDYIVAKQDGEWYLPYFQEFYDKGIIENIFTKEQADEEVTGLEVSELLTTMLKRVETIEVTDLSKFNDTEGLDIQIASIMDGFPDGTLKLNSNLSRIEAIIMLVNTIEGLGW